MSQSISYADAGVSIDNANRAVAKIREYARSTFNERTLTEIGSFGGMFSGAFPNMAEPILVAPGVEPECALGDEMKGNTGEILSAVNGKTLQARADSRRMVLRSEDEHRTGSAHLVPSERPRAGGDAEGEVEREPALAGLG